MEFTFNHVSAEDLLRYYLGSSDRLFHGWHKYRDGKMAWSTFLGYARPIR
jgi:hypothetical protein